MKALAAAQLPVMKSFSESAVRESDVVCWTGCMVETAARVCKLSVLI